MVLRGNVAFLLLLLAAWLALPGCSRHEPVASVASASGHAGRLDPMSPSQNTFSTVFQSGRLLAAFNNASGSPMGWGFIDNPSPTTTIPWTLCDAAGAGPCGGVLMAPGQTAWMGQPSLVAAGGGDVIYASLADMDGNTGNGAEAVVVSTSTDNGGHFSQAQVVNSDGGDSCNSGTQDMPHVTIDATSTPGTPRLYVVWRHKGASSFGGCIKAATITSSPFGLSWDFLSHSIANMDREDDLDSTMGQGALMVQAGEGAVTVVYTNNDEVQGCPTTNTSSLAWGSVSSYDGGATWTSSTTIYHTTQFRWCLVGGKVQNSLRSFAFARAPGDGRYWAVVNDSANTMRVFTSASKGASWVEECPGDASHPIQNFAKPGQSCAIPLFQTGGASSLMPSLAIDGRGWLSIVRYDSDAGDKYVQVVMNESSDPLNVTANTWQPGTGNKTLTIQNIFRLPTGGSYYALGNYNEMAAAPLTVCESQNTTLDVFPVYTAYDKNYNQLGTGQDATITP